MSLLAAACVSEAWSSESISGRQAAQIRVLKNAAEVYHSVYGSYPATDGDSTWFEKLIEEEILDAGILESRWGGFGASDDGLTLLGAYGQPIIYELHPGLAGGDAVFRSIGRNGIDDNGKLDDWDSRYGPNAGYWYKDHWPALYRSAARYGLVCGVITVLLVVLVRKFVRMRLLASAILCLTLGFMWVTIWPDGDLAPFRTVTTADMPDSDPVWIGIVHLPATLLFLAGVVQALVLGNRFATAYAQRRWMHPANTCISCGYDLRGSPTSICPECGTDQAEHSV